ncbi:hypothetical protein [uncultured Roseibium sp.]|uniref:hypothetical protein n=1 Tax=uncultured Roseibium sp. TaxID=1936171 RepID=UPI00262B6C45|nr:hypothetical protein [uncultured Roseibium sp.]
MTWSWYAAVLLTSALLSVDATAQPQSVQPGASPYAGLETREIKSLSKDDISELLAGGGWRLALPAELNGKPGPLHLLELSEELDLSTDQIKSLEALYADMREDAIVTGKRFIQAEAALSQAFKRNELDEKTLRKLVTNAKNLRAELRFIHLSRHLRTPDLLTEAQVKQYNYLRGYSADPCENVPSGHDPTMWRRHNGCE